MSFFLSDKTIFKGSPTLEGKVIKFKPLVFFIEICVMFTDLYWPISCTYNDSIVPLPHYITAPFQS